MRWLDGSVRRGRIRRKLCPEGHGPLTPLGDGLGCGTCGWMRERGKGVHPVERDFNAVCWVPLVADGNRQIAVELFSRIQGEFPQLAMALDRHPKTDDVSLDVPVQPGLGFSVKADLLDDVFRITVSHSLLEWTPCDDGVVQEAFFRAVCGLLSGRVRILEYSRGTRAVRAELQEPDGWGWKTVETWVTLHWPFPRRITIREIRNQRAP